MAEDVREQIARALAGAGVMVAQALNPEDLARIVLAVPAVAEAFAAVERVRALAEEWAEMARDHGEQGATNIAVVYGAHARHLRRAVDGEP